MKKHSCGGDSLTGRVHCGLVTNYIPHYLVFCFANDLPKINPFDSAVNDCINIISYSKKFVDEPTNELELKLDNNINAEISTDKFKLTFLFLILEYYLEFIKNGKKKIIPNEIKNNKTEWVGVNAENNNITKIFEEYTITNNKDDFVQSRDIDIWVKDSSQTITMTKFSIELKKYCSIKKFNNV